MCWSTEPTQLVLNTVTFLKTFLSLEQVVVLLPHKNFKPTKLFFFLQQDEAERRVSQNELSGCGQAHDAGSNYSHITRPGKQRGEIQTVKI